MRWLVVAAACWIAVVLVPKPVPEPIPPGRLEVTGRLLSDVKASKFGYWALIGTAQGPVLLELAGDREFERGDTVLAIGSRKADGGEVQGVAHRGVLDIDEIELVAATNSPLLIAGRSVRRRVVDRLAPLEDGRALLAGFLVGDTSGVDEIDENAMRRAGLSHFTAVSGSNVALFLGLLFVVAGPFGIGPKRRAVVGLLGLPVYAAATAFEPSVMRASVMAGVVLVGRLFGFVLEAWQLLAAAVIGLLVLNPSLTASVGFQLSVAATAGVLVGSRWPTQGGMVSRALLITMGAQIAVAPLLIFHFGAVPLLSPLINLVAAPVVTASTLIGAVGVLGFDPAIPIAVWLADLILDLARGTSAWPQIGPGALAGLLAGGLALHRWRSLVPLAFGAAVAAIVFSFLGSGQTLDGPGLVVLDVGQGDSILLVGGDGSFALVDGGPDAVTLIEKLSGYGVHHLDGVVLTHVHADHVTGLIGLFGRISIGEIWIRTDPHETRASRTFLERAQEFGIAVVHPSVGDKTQIGNLVVTVEGPLRRYASPNDQSIVLEVRGPGRSALLSGDIETIAQAELGHLKADILKVPHQGAATSSPEWLAGVGAEVAVISVGPNQFGHPAQWVVDLLTDSGVEVFRTDQDGDVVVSLDG
jgi:competence protein ComEC